MRANERYEFGDFTLDVPGRKLSRGREHVPLTPKAHDVLVTLVRSAGRLVSKRELLDTVWPECFVEEGIVAVHVSTLRKALGDNCNDHKWIETVPKCGYRFIAHVRSRASNSKPTVRTEVFELFGKGRSHLLTASPFEIPDAIAAFRAAIALDPTYAAAHAGLALACCAQAEFRLAPHAEAFAEAKTSALTALGLDDSCTDAQVALGAVLFLSEWNWTGAERSLTRALDLNPNHTEAYLLYGRLMEALGELDRGLELKQRALERDPFSALVHTQIALSYWNQRKYQDSIEWANKALSLNPKHLLAREHLAAAYWKTGNFDLHMREIIKHAESYGTPQEVLAELRSAYHNGGRLGVVRYTLDRLPRDGTGAPDFQLALLYSEQGDLDKAFAHLDQALDERDPCLVHLAVAPQWDAFRGDSRFAACVRRLGLPQSI